MKNVMLRSWKDFLLLSTALISYLPSFFHGSKERIDFFLLVEYTRRIDFFFLYLGNSINFLIFAFLLLFPKGLSQQMKVFTIIVCILDFLHFILLSKLYFGIIKLFAAIFIHVMYKIVLKWVR